jgi:hypothetical protein
VRHCIGAQAAEHDLPADIPFGLAEALQVIAIVALTGLEARRGHFELARQEVDQPWITQFLRNFTLDARALGLS